LAVVHPFPPDIRVERKGIAMAENTDRERQELYLLDGIRRVEEKLRRIDDLRHRQARYSLIGFLLILTVLLAFIYRISVPVQWYRDVLNDPMQRQVLAEQMLADSQAREILQTELQAFAQDFNVRIRPRLGEMLADELDELLPQLSHAALDMTGRLHERARETVEGRVVEALAASFDKMEEDLRETFPEFSDEEIEKLLERSRELFVEKIHDVLEERLSRVQASVDDLKATVSRMGEGPKSEQIELEDAKTLFIDALLEILAYELRPELGMPMAD